MVPETGSYEGGIMKRRMRMSKGRSKRVFSRTAGRTHKKNLMRPVMRGGIRL